MIQEVTAGRGGWVGVVGRNELKSPPPRPPLLRHQQQLLPLLSSGGLCGVCVCGGIHQSVYLDHIA